MPLELYPHQKKALARMKNGCVLAGGVGSGKSLTACQYYWDHEQPRDIVVITTAKKRDSLDWQRDFASYAIGMTADSTVAGVLTIDSWNNIQKYKECKDKFFIFDEQRAVGTGKWAQAFIKIARNNHWLMLSATPGDTWIDYIPLFVANGFYRNVTQFKKEHVRYSYYGSYPKLEGYSGEGKLQKLRAEILVPMPYPKKAERRYLFKHVDTDKELIKEVTKTRWDPFNNEPMADIAALYRVVRRISNMAPGRLAWVRKIADEYKKVIVFYNFDYELEILRTLMFEGYNVAEWNGHKHEEIPSGDSWVYLVQYTAGAEGWNCVETDTMVFYSLNYSYKIFEQAQGRIDRLNTPYKELCYHILKGSNWCDLAILEALRRKENFNEIKHSRVL